MRSNLGRKFTTAHYNFLYIKHSQDIKIGLIKSEIYFLLYNNLRKFFTLAQISKKKGAKELKVRWFRNVL